MIMGYLIFMIILLTLTVIQGKVEHVEAAQITIPCWKSEKVSE